MIQINENFVNVGSRTTLDINDIVMLVAETNYTTLHLSDGNQILVSYHLGKLQGRLLNYPVFIRPNRNTIINTNHIEKIGTESIRIHGFDIRMSRRRKEKIFNNLLSN